MTPSAPASPDAAARRGYHHGRLKDALIEAARTLMTERGPAGFTLAEAAKLAGVTAAAPYRHFNDRNALLCELARRGFDAFSLRLKTAWGDGRPDPITALSRMGQAYLDFARREPGLYAAMFGDARVLCAGPPIESSDAALNDLRAAASAALAYRGASGTDGQGLGVEIWAVAHGVASLANAGHLPEAPGRDAVTILSDSVAALIDKAVRDQTRVNVR